MATIPLHALREAMWERDHLSINPHKRNLEAQQVHVRYVKNVLSKRREEKKTIEFPPN